MNSPLRLRTQMSLSGGLTGIDNLLMATIEAWLNSWCIVTRVKLFCNCTLMLIKQINTCMCSYTVWGVWWAGS